MIYLGSVVNLHRHHRELVCYCHRRDRWAVLDLAAMVTVGLGSRRLPIAVRRFRTTELKPTNFPIVRESAPSGARIVRG